MRSYKGKTVVITGGTRGIGRACCMAFAAEGANIVFTYSRSRKEAGNLVRELQAKKTAAIAVQADVREYEQCRKVVDTALKKFGRVDVLVNNAGIASDRLLALMDVEEWKKVITTNLDGVFNMTKSAVMSFIRQKEGCIINMSSVSGIIGLPGQANYSASKAGIIGFTKAMAKELAGQNVRVNAVCPGFIATEMFDAMKEEYRREMVGRVPLRRPGTAAEVADLCVFIASDKARYITGEVIKIDGGLAM